MANQQANNMVEMFPYISTQTVSVVGQAHDIYRFHMAIYLGHDYDVTFPTGIDVGSEQPPINVSIEIQSNASGDPNKSVRHGVIEVNDPEFDPKSLIRFTVWETTAQGPVEKGKTITQTDDAPDPTSNS